MCAPEIENTGEIMLQTRSEIAFTSPLAITLKGKNAVSSADIGDSVGLADLSGQAVWHIRGKNAASTLSKAPSPNYRPKFAGPAAIALSDLIPPP